MSRIGNRILTIPNGVQVKLTENNLLNIAGGKGTLEKALPKEIKIIIDQEKNTISTTRPNDNKKNKQLHGTVNSLINGMLIGVSKGFIKELEINGVGYRANVQGDIVNLNLGYSHPVKYQIPQGITVVTPKPTSIQISGFDKQLVGQVAAQIRQFRTPEPYKGKGIKYSDEVIRRKEGKSAGKSK
ncbi:MAG: 50S ribosomal protein L6 [Spiroplasma sp.]|nr:50S ribosomal protein L6 [Spiroplasma sp.]